MRTERDEAEMFGLSHPDLSLGFDEFHKFKRYTLKAFMLRNDRVDDSCYILSGNIIEISLHGWMREAEIVKRLTLETTPFEGADEVDGLMQARNCGKNLGRRRRLERGRKGRTRVARTGRRVR